MYESIKEIKTLMSKERASALSSTPVRASLERRVHCPPVLFFVSVFYIYFPHLSSAPPDQPLACEPASRSPHAFSNNCNFPLPPQILRPGRTAACLPREGVLNGLE